MRMDSKLEISLLYDFYKELLKPSQQQVVELYVNDDLSLSEVADILSISRQGVRDSLNRAVTKLREYESKLHLLYNYKLHKSVAEHLLADADEIRRLTDNREVAAICGRMIEETEKLLEREDQQHGV